MNALQQFLQAASNEAAGAVSGPVDLIGMGLRKLGVPVPRNALMSSDWMKQNGLMQDVPQSGASLAGQTFGLLSPVVAAAKAPQISRGLLQMGENAAVPRRLNPQTGAIAWQGSRHKFDQFDSSKIGTGEGNQSYGHGLYLAESPEVGKSYMTAGLLDNYGSPTNEYMSMVKGLLGKAREKLPGEVADMGAAAPFYLKNISDDALEVALLEAQRSHMFGKLARLDNPIFRAAAKAVEESPIGNLYKVDLPDEKIAQMVDWDKPLSQQSEAVRKAVLATKKQLTPDDVENLGGAAGVRALYDPASKIDNFLGTWQSLRGRADAGEGLLRQEGIPGIRYLDSGSRATGGGTSNFVVFPGEENALKILERNGKPIR